MTLSILLIELASKGCVPSLYYRGKLWRAHVNAAGAYWYDDTAPLYALRGAVELWKNAGKPLDGMAASAAGGK